MDNKPTSIPLPWIVGILCVVVVVVVIMSVLSSQDDRRASVIRAQSQLKHDIEAAGR